MYDFVNISVPVGSSTLESLVKDDPNCEPFETKKHRVQGYRFPCGNLKGTLVGKWLTLKGSLPKFEQGHSIVPLSISQTKDTLEELSEILNVNVLKGRVTQYEVSNSYNLSQPCHMYFSLLKLWRGKEPSELRGNKLAFGCSTQLVFYDKLAEMRNKGYAIPLEYQGMNLARYELRKTQDVSERWGRSNKSIMPVSGLYDPKECKRGLDEYHRNYKLIQKVTQKNGVRSSELNRKVKEFVRGYLSW